MTAMPDRCGATGGSSPARAAAAAATADLPTARALVAPVLSWLRRRDPDALLRTVAGWPPTRRAALRHFLIVQGLAPLVADVLAAPGSASAAVPEGARGTVDWLAEQAERSRTRAARLAEDLTAVLAGAAAAGLPVLLMKGAVLAHTRYREPGLRPMADLDLLVRPADEPGLHAVLVGLGYRLVGGENRRHRSYGRPEDRVVAIDGVHPGNPRKVEVHTSLNRSVWSDRVGVDVAPYLWAAGRGATLLGQPAVVPSDAALLVDVATHATSHLMHGLGRVLHWYDVAALAPDVAAFDDAFADTTYPALALAARAFPDERLASHVARQTPLVGAGLVRLAARVPLDDRAGLNLRGVNVEHLGWLAGRWRHWRPNPWSVRLAHPHAPVPLAYGAYLGGVGAYFARWAVHRLRRGAPRP